MPTDTGGIITDWLPIGNSINANLQGLVAVANNNTPFDVWAQSYARAYTQQRPDIIEVLPGETGQSDATQSSADIDFEKRLKQLLGIAVEEETTIVTESPVCQNVPDFLKPYCDSTVDLGKRIGISVLAVALILLGIWSVR